MNRIDSFNDWLAQKLTDILSTMWASYLAAILALTALPGAIAKGQFVQWFSQTFIQLVMLFVLMVVARLASKQQKSHHADAMSLAKHHHAEHMRALNKRTKGE